MTRSVDHPLYPTDREFDRHMQATCEICQSPIEREDETVEVKIGDSYTVIHEACAFKEDEE